MPKYAYKALNKEGKEVFGIVDADTQALAINEYDLSFHHHGRPALGHRLLAWLKGLVVPS